MDDNDAAPGKAKNAEAVVASVLVDVNKPVPVRVATSAGVKAVPKTVDDVGLASINWMYFSEDNQSNCTYLYGNITYP